MSGIFGGSKRRAESRRENRAFDQISTAYSPMFGQASGAANQIAALLGGDASGFNAYKDATGFDFMAEQGSRGITGNAAAGGLLRSGATGQALANFGNQMQNQYAQNYINQLLGLGNMGMQAGQLVAGAGDVATSTESSRSKPGLGGFIGNAAAGIAASDPRLKKDIQKIGSYGKVGLYTFKYKDQSDELDHIGVMADEVKKHYPGALGPMTEDGFMTVNYDKLEQMVEG